MLRIILPILFLLLPLAEIACFIMVGRSIGLWPTLSLVILSAILGVFLVRIQGFGALMRLRQSGREGKPPGREILDAAMIVVAGFLLLVPGFLTDILGLFLFLPPVRQWVWNRLISNFVVVDINTNPRPWPKDKDRTIELDADEYRRERKD
ncbi:MAG: membrane protein FxsA [Shinella sp.]|nr:membrane protein FxsA [Shinella sp.]